MAPTHTHTQIWDGQNLLKRGKQQNCESLLCTLHTVLTKRVFCKHKQTKRRTSTLQWQQQWFPIGKSLVIHHPKWLFSSIPNDYFLAYGASHNGTLRDGKKSFNSKKIRCYENLHKWEREIVMWGGDEVSTTQTQTHTHTHTHIITLLLKWKGREELLESTTSHVELVKYIIRKWRTYNRVELCTRKDERCKATCKSLCLHPRAWFLWGATFWTLLGALFTFVKLNYGCAMYSIATFDVKLFFHCSASILEDGSIQMELTHFWLLLLLWLFLIHQRGWKP